MPPVRPSGLGCMRKTLLKVVPIPESEAALLTRMPAEVEMTKAGIWVHQPVPHREKGIVHHGVDHVHAVLKYPDGQPAQDVDDDDENAAMASPRTNLLAPSMAP